MYSANFEKTINGEPVQLFHIFSQDISCFITNYGARVVSLSTSDKDSRKVDVILGFDSIDNYLNANEKYHGASIGRYANRIANGTFNLNGIQYDLAKNNGQNSLHGGEDAYHNKVWTCKTHESDKVILELISPHLEEGFPGELLTEITFHIQDSSLRIEYKAESSVDTVVNFTHHSYFNLNGEDSGSILNHSLLINSDYYTPVNENTIPTGSIDMVADTPFDFTTQKEMGVDIEASDLQLTIGDGYDHNFLVNQHVKGELNFAAKAIGDKSNIIMEVWSTEPGVQFYTANHFDGSDIGKSKVAYGRRSGFCLETQHFPDSPNQSHFPTTLLKRDHVFESVTEYRFSVI